MWLVGDVQGYLEQLRNALRASAVIDASGHWSSDDESLVVVGDLVDRGPDGIGVIDFLMRLQVESRGAVEVLLGNHDVLLLAARAFPGDFGQRWRESGGQSSDLDRLTDAHVAWLRSLPALSLRGDVLLAHADALFYLGYGSSVWGVNYAIGEVLSSGDVATWSRLLDDFTEHRAFSGPEGCANLDRFLGTYGGKRLVHGHTPIARMLQQSPGSVTAPYIYCRDRCINVDPGIYLGGPGFAFRLSPSVL